MIMQPINSSTYGAVSSDSMETVIGDETQAQFFPRIKIKKWGNECNFSLGLKTATPGGTVSHRGGRIKHTQNGVTSQFYPISLSGTQTPTAIRRALKGDLVTALEATAEYELFKHISQPGDVYISHYIVKEPAMATFDLMPASLHFQADQNAMVKDFNYPDKSAYHPSDVPIPSYDKLKLYRFYTPYTDLVNPYYMDEGLHNIDLQWYQVSLQRPEIALMDVVEAVLNAKNVPTKRHPTRAKLYFKHNDRWVKFFSAQPDIDGLYAYFNVNTAYNKAYDFYRPDVKKDIRDQYAYGLQVAYPDITHDVVDEIIQAFAQKLNLPLQDEPFTADETTQWQGIQKLQDNYDWAVNGLRQDASWFRMPEVEGFEFEVILSAKPASNEVALTGSASKNTIAYFQAPISSADQIKQRIKRAPHLQGSLAVYHIDDSKSGFNATYKAGKIAHIYRPIANDSAGNSVFCDFKETLSLADGAQYDLSNGLTVVVPQTFLDSAVYPITVDPTFGYTTGGGTVESENGVTLVGSSATTAASGGTYVSSIAVFMQTGTAASATYEFGIYDTSGNFNYQARTDEASTLYSSSTWVFLAITSPRYPLEVKASTSYVLAAWGAAGSGYATDSYQVNFDSVTGTSYNVTSTYSTNNWPKDLSGKTTTTSKRYSIYANIGYQFPVMVGTSSILTGLADRYAPMTMNVNAAWITPAAGPVSNVPASATNASSSSAGFDLTRFYIALNNAPGSGRSRTISIQQNNADSQFVETISGTNTTVYDTLNAAIFSDADDMRIHANVSTSNVTASQNNWWRMIQTGQYQMLFSASGAVITTTNYIGIDDQGTSATSSDPRGIMPINGTINSFRAKMNNTLTSGNYVAQFFGGAAGTTAGTAVTLASGAQTAASATANNMAAGDLVSYKITYNSPSTNRSVSMSAEFDSSGNSGPGPGFGVAIMNDNVTALDQSSTYYNNWHGSGAWSTTELKALGGSVIFVRLAAKANTTPGAAKSRKITLRVNGTDTDATVTLSNTTVTYWPNSTTFGVIPINEGDMVSISQVPSGSPATSAVIYSLAYTTNINFIKEANFNKQLPNNLPILGAGGGYTQ